MRHRERIWHFFEHYKALEQGKWAKITGWGNKAEAQRILMEAIERYKKQAGGRLTAPLRAPVAPAGEAPVPRSALAPGAIGQR